MKTSFITFQLYPLKLVVFVLVFILMTIVGTLSHEYGHIAVAKYLGYETRLYYGSMNYDRNLDCQILEIKLTNLCELRNHEDFAQKAKLEKLQGRQRSDSLMISLGGPLQTILVGMIGLIFLIVRRKEIYSNGLQLYDWATVFLTLFWLREVTFLKSAWFYLTKTDIRRIGSGDEVKIAYYLDLPLWSISLTAGLIGLLISLYIIFHIIPLRLRLTFILGGLIGGIAGSVLWFWILGPIVLPVY